MWAMDQDQIYEQTGLKTKMKIEVTVLDEDFDHFESIGMHVRPSDSVDALGQDYLLADMIRGKVPADLSQIFLNGVSLIRYEDYETFGQCGLREGDTIFLLLAPKEIRLKARSFLTGQEVTLVVSTFITLAGVKEILYENHSEMFQRFDIPYEQLVISTRCGEFQREDITLAHCNLKDLDTVYVDVVHYDISVAIPTFERTMQRVVFLPDDTIGTIKGTIEGIQLSRNRGVLTNDVVPTLLRGAIQNRNGTLVYLCLHLNGKKMGLHMDESTRESLRPIYHCALQSEHTVKDIYRIIEKKNGYKLACIHRERAKNCLFDYTWTRTFAPQIDVDPVTWCDDKHLPLYFLKCVTRTNVTRRVSSLCTVHNLVEKICEKENMKGAERDLCLPRSRRILAASSPLYYFGSCLSPKIPLTLRKRKRPTYQREMKIYVTWPGSLASPTEVIVEPDETIISLKDHIADIFKVPISWQKLVFSGEILADNHARITRVGIHEDAIVEVRSNFENEPVVIGKSGTEDRSTEKSLTIGREDDFILST